MQKFLIDIVADDFGYCPERNRSILECFQKGIVTRASLLVGFPFAKEAAESAVAVGLPMGLHFNITEFTTILPASEISSLYFDSSMITSTLTTTTKTSFHLYDKFSFRAAFLQGLISPDHIAAELVAQIQRFQQLTGYLPAHLDGHQHIHIVPGVASLIAKTLHQHFPPSAPSSPSCAAFTPTTSLRIPSQSAALPLRELSASHAFRAQVAADALSTREEIMAAFPDSAAVFVGLTTMGARVTPIEFVKMVREEVEHLAQRSSDPTMIEEKSPILIEWMIHPSYLSKVSYADAFSQAEERLVEHDILTQDIQAWLTCFEEFNFHLNR